jgi:hypothetical protein
MTSSRVRFATARDVCEAFTNLRRIAPAPGDASTPLDYVRRLLVCRRPIDAIAFLAHLLPRREAVWWARQCVGAILGARAEDEALRAADAWVRAPEEERRRAALDIGAAGDQERATTWLALAVGRSGGSVSAPDQKPIAAAPRPARRRRTPRSSWRYAFRTHGSSAPGSRRASRRASASPREARRG